MKKLCITSGLIASVGLFGATTLADGPQTTATSKNAGIGVPTTQTRPGHTFTLPNPAGGEQCVYDNFFPLDDFGSPASQKDTVYPFWAEAADDFVLEGEGDNGCVLTFVGTSVAEFNTPGGLPVDPAQAWTGVKVTVYEDAAAWCGPGFLKGPAGEPIDLPGGDRQHVEYCPGGVVCELKIDMANVEIFQKDTICTAPGLSFDVGITIPEPSCVLEKNHKYWMAVSPVSQFGLNGQTAIRLGGIPGKPQGHPAQQIFLLLGLPWTEIAGNAGDQVACPGVPPAGSVRDLAYFIVAEKEDTGGCPKDLTGDGVINAADLAVLLGAWGPCAGCSADFDGDGDVDAADLANLLGAWGAC